MTSDPFKPIIDSMLHEVLRERTPPDVTDRVLRALDGENEDQLARESRSGDLDLQGIDLQDIKVHTAYEVQASDQIKDQDESLSTRKLASAVSAALSDPSDSETPISESLDRQRVESNPRHSREWMSPVFWMACGAASILLIATITAMVVNRDNDPSSDLASESDSEEAGGNDDGPLMVERENFAENDRAQNGDDLDRRESDGQFVQQPPFGSRGNNANRLDSLENQPWTTRSDDEMITFVNRVIGTEIDRQQVRPTSFIEDSEWHERTFDVLLGRKPNDSEVQYFTQLEGDGETRREQLVDRLLATASYRDELADHWSGLLANELVGSQGAQRERHVEQLQTFLASNLRDGRGLDEIAFQLITAKGSDQPDNAQYNPAASFVISHSSGNAKHRLAGDVSRVFMGRRMDCVKCHSESIAGNWDETDFWQFDAFFRQTRVKRIEGGFFEVTDQDYAGEINNVDDAVFFFEDDEGLMIAAYPVFQDQLITASGRLSDINRREELAQRLTRTTDFRRVTVNRIWSQVFGVGMTRPVDEFGSHNPVSHPTLLTELSDQLGAHDYQLWPLLKWMVLSDPFRRSAADRWDLATDSPYLGRRALFSRYYRPWDRPEQASEAFAAVMNQRDALDQFAPGLSGIFANIPSIAPNNDVVPNDLPKVDEDLASAFLLRTKANPWGVSPRYEGLLLSIASSDMPLEERIEHLFQIGIARQPTNEERRRALAMVDFRTEGSLDDATEEDIELGLQDVWWTLMLSAEFDH